MAGLRFEPFACDYSRANYAGVIAKLGPDYSDTFHAVFKSDSCCGLFYRRQHLIDERLDHASAQHDYLGPQNIDEATDADPDVFRSSLYCLLNELVFAPVGFL